LGSLKFPRKCKELKRCIINSSHATQPDEVLVKYKVKPLDKTVEDEFKKEIKALVRPFVGLINEFVISYL